jgi:hypothetical protein
MPPLPPPPPPLGATARTPSQPRRSRSEDTREIENQTTRNGHHYWVGYHLSFLIGYSLPLMFPDEMRHFV